MRVGIVGAEGAKFTPEGEAQARAIIRSLLAAPDAVVVSGGCHLGGVDIWAEEEAVVLGRKAVVFRPKTLMWSTGYKPRNLLIAEHSEVVHCIAVDMLPREFGGMTFPLCYHCGRKDHVKSGGCWTMKRAKRGELHIVANYPARSPSMQEREK